MILLQLFGNLIYGWKSFNHVISTQIFWKKKTPGQYFNQLKAIFGKIDIISAISLLI